MMQETSRLLVYEACQDNNLLLAQKLHVAGIGSYGMEIDAAALNENFEMIRWLHLARPHGATTQSIDALARHGRTSIIKWLAAHRPEGPSMWTAALAAEGGHFHTLCVLQELWPHAINSRAANYSSTLKIAKWLHEMGHAPTELDQFARLGAKEVVKWAIALGLRPTGNTIFMAVMNAHTGVLHIFSATKELPTLTRVQETWTMAHKNRNVLAWCRQYYGHTEVAPVPEPEIMPMPKPDSAESAMAQNKPDVAMHYMHLRNYGPQVWTWAAYHDNFHVLQELRRQEICGPCQETVNTAVNRGNIIVAQWLHQNYGLVPSEHVLLDVFIKGHIATLDYFRYKPCDEARRQAAAAGNYFALKWAGIAWNEPDLIHEAARNQQIHLLQRMHRGIVLEQIKKLGFADLTKYITNNDIRAVISSKTPHVQ